MTSRLAPLQSPLLALPGIAHAFFTRQGGASTGIYDSLNLGRGSKDDPAAVEENRRRTAAWFGLEPEALNLCHQCHSDRVEIAEGPWADYRPEADGVVTTESSLICGALAADCAPILLADASAGVVGAVHAGWRGALSGVAQAAVAVMIAKGAKAKDIVAVVGPCIGPASYEVGLEFLERFTAEAPGSERFFSPGARSDKRLFDLPAFVLSRLNIAGVEACGWIGRDTCAEPDRLFSNRRAFLRGEGDYGRLLSAIRLT